MKAPVNSERPLFAVGLVINNVCNLACPHCYLNMSGEGYLPQESIDRVFAEPPALVSMVGMEPLYDRRSAQIVREVAVRGRKTETMTTMITNGLGLHLLTECPSEELPDVIDISLDGGPKTYAKFRGNGKNHFPKIAGKAAEFRSKHPETTVSITNTLYRENCTPDAIEDMVRGSREVSSEDGAILFSPFFRPLVERGQREATAEGMPLEAVLAALKRSSAFMEEPRAKFFAGQYNARIFGKTFAELTEVVREFGLEDKSRLDEAQPHEYGLRILWDGRAIRIDHTLHTTLYERWSIPVDRPLLEIQKELLEKPSVFELV